MEALAWIQGFKDRQEKVKISNSSQLDLSGFGIEAGLKGM
jgi:hypothetical protein